MTTIVTTGSTGRLGSRVARRLADAGAEQRLLVRDPTRAPDLPRTQVHAATYADQAAVRRVLDGADVVFLVSGAETLDRVAEHRSFIDAATDAGVGHLVYTSFFGASPTSTFTLARDHAATEQIIRDSGLPFTFLRDNLYADFLPLMVGEDGVIRGPAGDGRAAVVAQDDIADVAAVILQTPAGHAGVTYDLTGPQSLGFDEMAAIITTATDRPVRYEPETVDEAYVSRASHGAPDWQLDAWVSTYTAVAAGELDGVTDAVPTITGRPATSLADVLARRG